MDFFDFHLTPEQYLFFGLLTFVEGVIGVFVFMRLSLFFYKVTQHPSWYHRMTAWLMSLVFIFLSASYAVAAAFGFAGVLNWETSLGDIAYVVRPFIMAGVILTGHMLTQHFKRAG